MHACTHARMGNFEQTTVGKYRACHHHRLSHVERLVTLPVYLVLCTWVVSTPRAIIKYSYSEYADPTLALLLTMECHGEKYVCKL